MLWRRSLGPVRCLLPMRPAEPDFKSAMKWARQAADAGSASGQALLAYILTYGPEFDARLGDCASMV